MSNSVLLLSCLLSKIQLSVSAGAADILMAVNKKKEKFPIGKYADNNNLDLCAASTPESRRDSKRTDVCCALYFFKKPTADVCDDKLSGRLGAVFRDSLSYRDEADITLRSGGSVDFCSLFVCVRLFFFTKDAAKMAGYP